MDLHRHSDERSSTHFSVILRASPTHPKKKRRKNNMSSICDSGLLNPVRGVGARSHRGRWRLAQYCRNEKSSSMLARQLIQSKRHPKVREEALNKILRERVSGYLLRVFLKNQHNTLRNLRNFENLGDFDLQVLYAKIQNCCNSEDFSSKVDNTCSQ